MATKKVGTRQLILRKALELFLIWGYEGVSFSMIQEALGIGRATTYYYFKDKDELFKTVLKDFILGPKWESIELDDNLLLEDIIQSHVRMIDRILEPLEYFDNKAMTPSHVTALMHTAYNRFDDLLQEAQQIRQREVVLWRRAIENSIAKGIVRSDVKVDTLARMFNCIKDAYDVSMVNQVLNVDDYKEPYIYLYELIKN